MNGRKWRVWVAAVLLCAGCGGSAVIDGSSDAAYQRSLAAVKQQMSPAEEEAFTKALTTVALQGVEGLDGLIEATTQGKIRQRVDGMTAAEVLAEAARIDAAK